VTSISPDSLLLCQLQFPNEKSFSARGSGGTSRLPMQKIAEKIMANTA
jgi:hypothetical protein